MANLDYQNQEFLILDLTDNPVISNPIAPISLKVAG